MPSNKTYRDKHREDLLIYGRAYYEAHKEDQKAIKYLEESVEETKTEEAKA